VNLLPNAIEFTPAGARVRVTRQRAGAHAAIVVADDGTGVDRRCCRTCSLARLGDAHTG